MKRTQRGAEVQSRVRHDGWKVRTGTAINQAYDGDWESYQRLYKNKVFNQEKDHEGEDWKTEGADFYDGIFTKADTVRCKISPAAIDGDEAVADFADLSYVEARTGKLATRRFMKVFMTRTKDGWRVKKVRKAQ